MEREGAGWSGYGVGVDHCEVRGVSDSWMLLLEFLLFCDVFRLFSLHLFPSGGLKGSGGGAEVEQEWIM